MTCTTGSDPTRPHAIVLHDDRSLAAHVDALLSSAGFAVELAASPLALLRPRARAERCVTLYVLAASALDRRDRELVAVLREADPEATIIVLFPGSLRDTAAAMLEAGADASLPEPFYPGELTALARRALAKARAARGSVPAGASPDAAPASSPIDPPIDGSDSAPQADAAGAPAPPPVATPTATPIQQIAVGVAHAIRNPLQIMELMIASAESGDDLDVEALREMMVRIAGVVSDLSRFGDHTISASARLDVAALVREVFDAVPKSASPTLTMEGAADGIEILAQADLLRAALAVLRDRALRDTPRKGSIDVRVAVTADVVTIAVSDGGATPDADALVHFFEPAWDVDVVQAGTWLEMAAFAGMIRSQGGAVAVAPGAENGVTVTVRFALAGTTTDGA